MGAVSKPVGEDEILGLPKWVWAAIAGGVVTAGIAIYIFAGSDGETKRNQKLRKKQFQVPNPHLQKQLKLPLKMPRKKKTLTRFKTHWKRLWQQKIKATNIFVEVVMNWQSNVTHKPLNVAQRAKSQIYQLFIKTELQRMNRLTMTKLLFLIVQRL